MRSPPPAPWTCAARAAFFVERVCSFWDQHNPAGSNFCNDCGWPLHLKPCSGCGEVNDQAATNCYKCGAACPLFNAAPPPALWQADSFTNEPAIPSGVIIAKAKTQLLYANSNLRTYWRSTRPSEFLLAVFGTLFLVVFAYGAYRINPSMTEAKEAASQPIIGDDRQHLTATPDVLVETQLKFTEPETTTGPRTSTNAAEPEARQLASGGEQRVSIPATTRTSGHQRLLPERPTPVGATARVVQPRFIAPVRGPVAEIHKTVRPDRWQAMHADLARCSGHFFARLVCDQRIRRQFCEGYWGKVPQCSNIINDHGQ